MRAFCRPFASSSPPPLPQIERSQPNDYHVWGAEPKKTAIPGGARPVAGWKGLESLAAEIQGLGRQVLTLVGDVSRAADAERFVAESIARFGRIDVLVNNAAAPHGADRRLIWEVPEEAWDLVLDVNLKGTFLMSRAVIPHMLTRRSGRIINMASVSAASTRAGANRPRGASARSPSASRAPRCSACRRRAASRAPTTSPGSRCSSPPSRVITSPGRRGTSTAGL